MAIGDNISNANTKATEAANKAKEIAAKAAETKAKAEAVKAQALAAKKKAQELADKGKKIKELAEKQKAKADQLKKSLADKQSFLKDQSNISATDAKAAIAAAVLPLLTKFVNAEKIANVVLNKLINDTKKKLKDKGRVSVVNGAITFVPKDQANYDRFKADFDRKVNRLKKIIKILKDIIDALVTLLKIIKTALIAFKAYLALLKKKITAEGIASAAELTTPSPTKPITAKYNIDKLTYDEVIEPLKEKIDNYILMVSFLQSILQVYQKMVNAIKVKLDTLSLTIVTSGSPISNDLQAVIITEQDITDTEYNNGDKTFTIKVITTPSGALQAIAYDSFSKLPITQTAPSKLRKADELINELKQILG